MIISLFTRHTTCTAVYCLYIGCNVAKKIMSHLYVIHMILQFASSCLQKENFLMIHIGIFQWGHLGIVLGKM